MWLVRLALRRPYTFVVMSALIALVGVLAIVRMPTDILPEIDIPVISVVWSYGGLPPEEMEKRVVTGFERFLTTVVNDIEHIESQSLTGVSVIKVFFHPGAKIEAATAQITAASQTIVRSLPPGATPPLILRYSASNAPVLELALTSDTLSEQQMFDYGVNFLRPAVATVQGAGVPYPFGGKNRQVMIDIDLQRLYAWGLSPRDVANAVNVQNLTLPTGTIKIAAQEFPVLTNSSASTLDEISHAPVATVRGTTVFVGDVAHVRDGFSPQTSLVQADGKRAVLMPILKSAGASTLDVVSRIRAILPSALATLPKELHVTPLFDQSIFVRAAVQGVVREAVIAAGLTALMMLLFLGSWRSTLIVIVSIPLSILVSIVVLYAVGQSLNVMTLGGMALAVGILVDDATVEIENIHRNLAKGKPLVDAILDGAREIAVPAFVSTICICIAFVPIGFISGPARSLFVPLAMAVVFAMMTSYFLSRTLVPTLVRYLLEREHAGGHGAHAGPGTGRWHRFQVRFDAAFDRLRHAYGAWLGWALTRRRVVAGLFATFVVASMALLPLVGTEFFPSVDAGMIKLHVRTAPGMRIEETELRFGDIGEAVRQIVPAAEIETLIDNIGVTVSPINLSLGDGTMISSADGEILIALRKNHRPTLEYVRAIRARLARSFPDETFFFLAPDITNQVLNFGISAPVDVQIAGPPSNGRANLALARQVEDELRGVDGAVDVHLHQVPVTPELRIDVDRERASQLGLTQQDVAGDVLVSLSSSGQTAPNFWLDPTKGIQYSVAVQTPQYKLDSLEALANTPVTPSDGRPPQLLANVADIVHTAGPTNITHLNALPTLDVFANVDGRDLGAVATSIDRVLAKHRSDLPRGTTMRVRGQIEAMTSSFQGLTYGLVLAIVLVYLLMVVNFQSWTDPFVILMALPGAASGIVWILFLTGTTLSVPALTGAIMCVGVATANSILVVTFANDRRLTARDPRHREPVAAAVAAGMTRLRPVVMTAAAMIVGMLPMALGLGEAAEQNAPLGRAVIGGLIVATLSTLFFVPVMYAVFHRNRAASPAPGEST